MNTKNYMWIFMIFSFIAMIWLFQNPEYLQSRDKTYKLDVIYKGMSEDNIKVKYDDKIYLAPLINKDFFKNFEKDSPLKITLKNLCFKSYIIEDVIMIYENEGCFKLYPDN